MIGPEMIGLISALFTFEQSIWSKIPIIRLFLKKRKICLNNRNSDDPVTQAKLESFKSKTYAQYKEHLFTKDEIDAIINEIYEENKDVAIKESERQQLEFIIRDVFNKYNEFTQSQMTIGEKVINNIEEKFNFLNSKIDKLFSHGGIENELKNQEENVQLKLKTYSRDEIEQQIKRRYKKILLCIRENPSITVENLSSICGETRRSILFKLKQLKYAGILRRIGSAKNGCWEIVEK